MIIPALFGWFRSAPTTKPVPLDFLHSRDRFRDILEVERMRADRTGLPFSLVVFSLTKSTTAGPADTAATAETLETPMAPAAAASMQAPDVKFRFARYLERRRRATDHIGEMHDRHLGVVLWNTTEEGAWTFARDVVKKWDDDAPDPEVEVFLYPTYVAPRKGTPTTENTDRVDETDDSEQEFDSMLDDRPAEEVVDRAKPLARGESKSLEMLFVQALPFWKRVLDVAGAGFGLLALSPLFLVVAALVKWTSKGPVFFAQTRTGHGGRPFTIYKFRTMCTDAEAKKDALRAISEQDGPAFKLTNDPRITRVGHILRKTCIDELPQLWNVLIGDMTLVGPRPLDVKEADLTTGWERRRLDITPGLTCIWQVDGKSRVTFAEWMRMDIRYSRVRSFGEDAKLVLRTIGAMLRLKASQ